MRLILGGYANGRTAYAMQKYQLTAQDCFDASQQPLIDWQGQRLILHVESLAARWLTEEKDPGEEIAETVERVCCGLGMRLK